VHFVSTNQWVVPETTTLSKETWVAATDVRVNGHIEDEVFAFAVSNTLAGTVSRDAWLAGGTVMLSGRVGDDARLAGQAVIVDGEIGGDLLAAATTLRVSSRTVIGGEAALYGMDILCKGRVGGRLRIKGSKVTLGGTVAGPVEITASEISVLRGTRIDGDLHYLCPKELFLDESVVLGGELLRRSPPETATAPGLHALLFQLGLMFGSLAVGVPFLAVFPACAGRAVRALRTQSWKCLLTGIVAGLLMICLIPLSALTLLGMPMALMLACSLILLSYIGKIMVGLALGGWALRRRGAQSFGNALLTLVAGMLLIYGGSALPVIGNAVWLAAVVLGMGALLLALFEQASVPAPPGPPAGAPRHNKQ
jgi:cytoskeletal protein CcmA (bactofilin family)